MVMPLRKKPSKRPKQKQLDLFAPKAKKGASKPASKRLPKAEPKAKARPTAKPKLPPVKFEFNVAQNRYVVRDRNGKPVGAGSFYESGRGEFGLRFELMKEEFKGLTENLLELLEKRAKMQGAQVLQFTAVPAEKHVIEAAQNRGFSGKFVADRSAAKGKGNDYTIFTKVFKTRAGRRRF